MSKEIGVFNQSDLTALRHVGGVNEYLTISVSPLAYTPYKGDSDGKVLGYTGVIVDQGNLSTVSQLGDYDARTSSHMMDEWLRPAVNACLPESKDYPTGLLDAILSEIDDREPLAAVVLEQGRHGKIISLSSRTLLGKLSLEKKETPEFRPDRQPKTIGDRLWGRRNHDQQSGLTPLERETVIVAGAVMLTHFEKQVQQVTTMTLRQLAE